MLSLKPIFLWKYLKLKKNEIPENIRRLFYLSWEDALWDILDKKKVGKGNVVLVPEFFCGDVEDNIRNHGFKITYYPVSGQLTTTVKQLSENIIKNKPAVLVIFNAIGIRNRLFENGDRLKNFPENLILIEDSVHSIVDPEKITFLKKDHFIIDSLRKVVPLQGSVVYGQKNDLNFSAPPFLQSFSYAVKVIMLWSAMNFYWVLTQILSNTDVSIHFAKKANLLMKKGYDLIGNSLIPAPGFFLFDFFQQFIDFEKIRKIKMSQVDFYENKLTKIPENIFQKIPYRESDKGELIAYPLVLPINTAGKTLKQIRDRGLLLNFELNDSVWSRKQKIIYLPLGPHITENNLREIIKVILSISYSE